MASQLGLLYASVLRMEITVQRLLDAASEDDYVQSRFRDFREGEILFDMMEDLVWQAETYLLYRLVFSDGGFYAPGFFAGFLWCVMDSPDRVYYQQLLNLSDAGECPEIQRLMEEALQTLEA